MKLTYSKGRGNKIHLSIDGEYTITTDADFWFSSEFCGLNDISSAQLEQLTELITHRKAYLKGIDLLSRRDHSVGELVDKLARTFPRELCKEVVGEISQRGYVDDRNFAENYTRYLVRTKHFGKARIRDELYKKKLSSLIISEVLTSVEEETDPVASITLLLQTKFSLKLSNQKDIRRTVNSLIRMGYTYSDIRTALEGEEVEFYGK